MAATRKSILTFLMISGLAVAGVAFYILTRTNSEAPADNQTTSKEVVIEKETLQQLKSLGYTN